MRIPRLKRGDAIEVIWIDAHYEQKGWINEHEFEDNFSTVIRSVCQYYGQDDQYLVTAADRSVEKLSGIMRDLRIPKGCIKSIRRLT